MTKLKNHVVKNGRRLSQVLNKKFGVDLGDFEKALSGDVEAWQSIGELARQGRFSSEFAPKLAELYSDIMSGSEAYNKAVADILVQSGKSAIAIDKDVAKVALANTKYGHQRKELAQEFIQSKNAENTRYEYQINLAQIRGYIDAHLTSVDNQATLLGQSRRPEIKQIAADEQLKRSQINEAMSKGEDARYDLTPQKNYLTGIQEKLLSIKTSLGF